MLTNSDGSRYSMYSVAEIIEDRCEKKDFPYLSDILGSDWGTIFPNGPKSPEDYKAKAMLVAERYYQWL